MTWQLVTLCTKFQTLVELVGTPTYTERKKPTYCSWTCCYPPSSLPTPTYALPVPLAVFLVSTTFLGLFALAAFLAPRLRRGVRARQTRNRLRRQGATATLLLVSMASRRSFETGFKVMILVAEMVNDIAKSSAP